MDASSSPLYPLRGRARLSYYLQRLVAHVPHLMWRDYQLIAQPRTSLPAMPKDYSVRIAHQRLLRLLRHDFHLSSAMLLWRRQQNMQPLLALRHDVPVGLIWLTDQPFEEDEAPLRFHPPVGGAWDTGLYILPSERHRRAWAALWAGVAQWMHARQLDTCYSRINRANAASLASHKRMGAQDLGRLWLLGGTDFYWVPTHDLRLHRRSHRAFLDIALPRP